jgi:hypothetical protein
VLARYAEAAGLYFSLRPLLDEHSLGGPFRTFWKPPRLAAWFASYERFLEPYAKMAQRARVPEFITGAELSNFWRSPYWDRLDTVLRRVFKGRLAYCNNWSDHLTRATNAMGVLAMVDAYRPMHVPGNAGVARLTAAWDAYARRVPRGIVLSEVGIAAQHGAYARPFVVNWPGRPIVQAVQSRYFTAACNAVAREHLGGIYFWSVGIGQDLSAPPGAADPASFVASQGATAIFTCFMRLGSAR